MSEEMDQKITGRHWVSQRFFRIDFFEDLFIKFPQGGKNQLFSPVDFFNELFLR
jgi:hypothetical protein